MWSARNPPLSAPHHHRVARAAMVEAARHNRPSIGMVSLAHHGVLFLDEAAEFEPGVPDALREPLESGATIARAGFQISVPALRSSWCWRPIHVHVANALDTHRGKRYVDAPTQRRRYLSRLSGPLLDRVDARVVLHGRRWRVLPPMQMMTRLS